MSERRRHRSVDTIVTISHKWLQEKMLFVHKLMLYFKLILSEEGLHVAFVFYFCVHLFPCKVHKAPGIIKDRDEEECYKSWLIYTL